MPYILGLLILIFGGFVFRKTLIALLGVVLVLIALLGASEAPRVSRRLRFVRRSFRDEQDPEQVFT